jgi:ribosome-associated protein
VVPGPLSIRAGIVLPESELHWRFSRASGPGGQSVNTSDSRVELSFDLASSEALDETLKLRATARLSSRLVDGVITVTASEHRSQLRNREAAERRLVRLISDAIAPPPPPRRATRPTRGSVRRRLDTKRKRSDLKRQRQAPRD